MLVHGFAPASNLHPWLHFAKRQVVFALGHAIKGASRRAATSGPGSLLPSISRMSIHLRKIRAAECAALSYRRYFNEPPAIVRRCSESKALIVRDRCDGRHIQSVWLGP